MSVTSTRIEGNGASMLVQAIGVVGASEGLKMYVGTVISELPALQIKVDGLGYLLEKDDFLIAERIRDSLTLGDRIFVLVDGQEHFVIDKAVSL